AEGGGNHVLDGAFFPVGELHRRLFLAYAGALTAELARLFGTLAWPLSTDSAWSWCALHTFTGIRTALGAGFWFKRFTVPLGVAEVDVCPHEVVDGEVVFAVVEAGSATNDLLELNHGVDRAHHNDVANVAV